MTKEFFGGNLKQNPKTNTALEILLNGYLSQGIRGNETKDVVIYISSFPLGQITGADPEFINQLKSRGIELGCQNVSEYDDHDDKAPHTAQTSPLWLKNTGIENVLIGHSEVREEDEGVGGVEEKINIKFNRKIKTALKYGLRVVYCVGETRQQRNSGLTDSTIIYQLELGLKDIDGNDLQKIVIAYGPRWAIEHEPPTSEEIRQAHQSILDYTDNRIPVIYEGGVSPENIRKIMSIENVSGVLVGGASLDAEKFGKIVGWRN